MTQRQNSFIDPLYLQGEFYEKSTGSEDASYKVDELCQLIKCNPSCLPKRECRVADVGCGTGKTTFLLQGMINNYTGSLPLVDGYDIHPYISKFSDNDSIRFFAGDFCSLAKDVYDLVVLFDVIEHIIDPILFLKEVSAHTSLLAFHIPLDNSIFSLLRNLTRENLTLPGHILVLDLPAAINLLTFSGLRVLDYRYSPGFLSPSGGKTRLQRLMRPFRKVMYKISPYLTQKLLSGVSVTVLAWTPLGLSHSSAE
jgi:SAM-dependent methyltransferase